MPSVERSAARRITPERAWALALAMLLGLASVARADDCAAFEIIGDRIPQPLAGIRGDAANGPAVARAPDQGDCTICHRMPLPDRQFHGTVGPALDTVGARLDRGQLRLRVAAPKRLNPDSVMPAYCTTDGRHRVSPGFKGRPILDARQIEDLVAWLSTLVEKPAALVEPAAAFTEPAAALIEPAAALTEPAAALMEPAAALEETAAALDGTTTAPPARHAQEAAES